MSIYVQPMEYRKHVTSEGLIVRSKNEIIIAQQLKLSGLSYEYERPLGPFKPDFTIFHNNQVWYWEHLGALDNVEYKSRWESKKRWYEENGYSDRLITTEDRNGSIDVREIVQQIDRILNLDVEVQIGNIRNNSEGLEYTVSQTVLARSPKTTIAATYDPERRECTKHPDDMVIRITVATAEVPDECKALSWQLIERRNTTLVIQSQAVGGTKFIRDADRHETMRIRFFNTNSRDGFTEIVKDLSLNHKRLKQTKTSSKFALTASGDWEWTVILPDYDIRLGRVDDKRRDTSDHKQTAKPNPTIPENSSSDVAMPEPKAPTFAEVTEAQNRVDPDADLKAQIVERTSEKLSEKLMQHYLGQL